MSRSRKKHIPRKSERPGGARAALRRARNAAKAAHPAPAAAPSGSTNTPEQPMGLKTVYQAEIKYLQIMDEDGRIDAQAAGDVRDFYTDEKLLDTYREMIVARELDEA